MARSQYKRTLLQVRTALPNDSRHPGVDLVVDPGVDPARSSVGQRSRRSLVQVNGYGGELTVRPGEEGVVVVQLQHQAQEWFAGVAAMARKEKRGGQGAWPQLGLRWQSFQEPRFRWEVARKECKGQGT